MSKLKLYVSPSEIETFQQCRRLWAGVYIHGWKKPEKPATSRGIKGHSYLEKYLKDATPPDMTDDIGQAAAESLHILPAPGTCGVEQTFAFTAPGAWFTGVKDFVIRGTDRVIVGDHKFTGDKKWVKTEEEILYHPQAPIYAVDEFRRNPRLKQVELQWNYHVLKKPAKVIPVWQTISRELASDIFFGTFLPIAQEIESIRNVDDEELPHMLDLPPTPTACEMFGGCHLKTVCNLSPEDQFGAILMAGLLDKIRSQTPSNGAPQQQAYAPPENVPHPPQQQMQPQQGEPTGQPPPGWGQAFQQPSAPPQGYAPPPQQNYGQPPQGYGQPPQGYAPPAQQAQQQAPWQAPNMVPPNHPMGQAQGPISEALQAQQYAPQGYAPPPQQPSALPPPQGWSPPPRVEVAPKEPKTRKKTVEKIDDVPTTTVVNNYAPPQQSYAGEPAPIPAGYVAAAEGGVVATGFTLYINCRPLTGEVVNALDYCEAAHEQLRTQQKVTHYGLIDYGKGKAALQVALGEVLACNDPLTGDVVLLDSDIEKDCAPVFRGLAAKVVVGL